MTWSNDPLYFKPDHIESGINVCILWDVWNTVWTQQLIWRLTVLYISTCSCITICEGWRWQNRWIQQRNVCPLILYRVNYVLLYTSDKVLKIIVCFVTCILILLLQSNYSENMNLGCAVHSYALFIANCFFGRVHLAIYVHQMKRKTRELN